MTDATRLTGKPRDPDLDTDTPHARRADRLEGKPDQLNEKHGDAEDRQEALVDEGLEETFPASDPVSAKRTTSPRHQTDRC